MNAGEVIKALGGPNAVAKALGLGINAVSNWAMRGAIASEHHIAVWRLALAKDVDWAPPGAEGLVLVPDGEQSRSERYLLDAFRTIDDHGRELLLRLARSLRVDAAIQREAAE